MAKFFQTARFRIALWNTFGVAGIALAALFAVRQGIWWTMLQETDGLLLEDVREIELAINELPRDEFARLTDELRRKALGHRAHDWFVILLDLKGDVLWQSNTPPVELPDLKRVTTRGRYTIDNTRFLCVAVQPNEHDIQRISVGASLDHLLADVSRFDKLVLAASGSILLLSPLFGYLLAGRATRDVQIMSDTAARLKPAALDERLPLRGTNDEFDRLALTINSLLDRIALYIAQKRDFLADAAHELRTPLAAIHSAIEVALTKPRGEEEYRRLLEDVMDEGESLEMLVNQLLLMSEAAARPHVGEPTEVNLSDVVAKSVDMFSGVAEAREITLTAEISRGIFIVGNKAHLRQLLNNLLDNAIKYSPDKSQVLVRLVIDSAEHVILLSVADKGPGIPAPDIPQLFDRFFRVDRSRSRDERKGTGLGLSICKTIVEAHNGTITCASTAGQGTTMTVRFPLRQKFADPE
jgi:two-component system heavy metal sensor histidine kinase CusS